MEDALENEVSQVLDVCAEIRQMKKVQNILKPHGPRSELNCVENICKKVKNEQKHITKMTILFRLLIFNRHQNTGNITKIPTTNQFINILIGNKYFANENE